MKKWISWILMLGLVLSISTPVLAAGDVLKIQFKTDSTKMLVNGKSRTIEAPYKGNQSVMVPLQSVLMAYGAEINDLGKNQFNLVYRDTTVDFTVGSKTYKANEATRNFSTVPKYSGKSVMVPVDFIVSNFGGSLSQDKNSGMYTLLLSDDGAISDFSKVIGSISKAKVGNSYFGWNINIPKGSQVTDSSFSSKDITIESQQRGITIDVNVDVDSGKKLEDLVSQLKNPKDDPFSDSSLNGKVMDSSINSSANPAYGEILTTNYTRGSGVTRIYIQNGYVYTISCSSSKEVNPQKLKSDASFMSIVNSFKTGYKGNVQDTKDLSTVKDGMAKYVDPVFGFSMNVPAEWDQINPNDYSDMRSIKLGLGNKEMISISPEYVEGITDIDQYGDVLKEQYRSNYNSKYYNFMDKKSLSIAGMKACKLVYSVTYNGQKSIMDENLISANNILYHIKLKAPEAKYSKDKEVLEKILGTMVYAPKDQTVLAKAIESIKTNATANRVGKDDNLTPFEEKDYKWKFTLPGNWLNVPYFQDNFKTFSDDKNAAYIGVEAVENTSDVGKMDDRNVFDTLNSIQDGKDGYKFISKDSRSEKGTTVTVYKYRLEDDKTDTYGDVIHYIIHGDKYSYCYFYMIQDVYTSDRNVKEVNDIWDSFTTTK